MRGPLFAGDDYVGGRRPERLRTESLWVRTTVFADSNVPVVKMLPNIASIKDSYAPYAREHGQLYVSHFRSD